MSGRCANVPALRIDVMEAATEPMLFDEDDFAKDDVYVLQRAFVIAPWTLTTSSAAVWLSLHPEMSKTVASGAGVLLATALDDDC